MCTCIVCTYRSIFTLWLKYARMRFSSWTTRPQRWARFELLECPMWWWNPVPGEDHQFLIFPYFLFGFIPHCSVQLHEQSLHFIFLLSFPYCSVPLTSDEQGTVQTQVFLWSGKRDRKHLEIMFNSGRFSCQKSWDKPIGDIQLSSLDISQIHVIFSRYLLYLMHDCYWQNLNVFF